MRVGEYKYRKTKANIVYLVSNDSQHLHLQ